MTQKIYRLVFLTILSLFGGLMGTYFFSTWDKLSRDLKDISSMSVLTISLLIAGFLIVKILAAASTNNPLKQ